jgi:hypothetical protein
LDSADHAKEDSHLFSARTGLKKPTGEADSMAMGMAALLCLEMEPYVALRAVMRPCANDITNNLNMNQGSDKLVTRTCQTKYALIAMNC